MAASRIAPEARVLFLTAAGEEYDDELRRLLATSLNWSFLLHLALTERAAPVVWRRLSRLGVTDLDETLVDVLRRTSMVAGFRQEYLEGRLAATLDVLGKAGFPVLLLKGAALGLSAYASFRDRPMGDIDLLLPAEQAGDAFALLLRSGWERAVPADQQRFYDGHHHMAPLRDPRYADAVLEVHTQLFPSWSPLELSLDDLWAGARRVQWRGTEARVPSAEHALLHLCTHFAWSHMAASGAWRAFSDLHALQRHGGIEWDTFCELARQSRAASCCFWTLHLASRYAGVAIPDSVLSALRPSGSRRTLRLIERHLATNLLAGERACPSVRVLNTMWEAAIRPRRSGHGAVRPWHEAPRQPPSARRPGVTRLQAHLRKLTAWRRYLVTVLSG
jgi:hypothetical protein